MAKVDWNTKESAVGGTFETLPKGRYLTIVEDSELLPTKDRGGKYYNFEFSVLKPDAHKGRKLWARLNVYNPSETAQRIGREQFNALCHAVGRPDPGDTVELHGRPVILIVDIEPATKEYKEKNIVSGFLKPNADDAKLASERPAPPPRQPAPRPAAAAAGLDDDIPF